MMMKTAATRRLSAIIAGLAILIGLGHLAHAQEPDMEDYLLIEYTIADATGRKIPATILSKTATAIRFRRTSDGKKFDM